MHETAAHLHGVVSSLLEAGRTISAANEAKLRSALASLQAVLAQLGSATEADRQSETDVAIADARAALTEAEMSYSERERLVRDAINAANPLPTNGSGYRYVVEQYDDAVIYSEESGGTSGYFKRTYSIDANGKVELGDPAKVVRQIVYTAVSEAQENLDPIATVQEAGTTDLEGDVVPLVEKAIRADGTVSVKLISPGWGSSGFYSAEVLKRDGPKVWKKGAHQYINHPTEAEAKARPERDVRDLAAVLTTDATYQEKGADGPGLYAESKVFSHWRPFIAEVAPHTGVSIRAQGRYREGQAEGKKGRIIEKLEPSAVGVSADFVTAAGRGGKVLELFESARAHEPHPNPDPEPAPTPKPTPAKEGRAMSREGWEETALTEQLRQQGEQIKALQESLDRERERSLLIEAKEIVMHELSRADLPDVTRARLAESLVKSPPIAEGVLDKDGFVETIREAVKSEVAYLASVGAGNGRIRGMGSGAGFPEDEVTAARTKLKESFIRQGMSPEAAELAAAGRR